MAASAQAKQGATFAALAVRNFRLYFVAQAVSVSGNWMQTVAMAALVLKLTGSGTQLGLVTGAQFLPVFVLGPYGGVVATRVDKRRLIRITQALFLADSLLLGVLTMAGHIPVPAVYVLAACAGVLTALDNPARQAIVYELVGPDVIANAVTLNFITMNAARIVGPALTGLLVSTIGIGPCFVLNAATFLAPIVAFALMRESELREPVRVSERATLREGFAYVWRDRSLRTALAVMALLGALTYEFQVTLPLLGERTFGGDASTYSWLFAAMGVGGVVIGLASAGKVRPSAESFAVAALALGALCLAVAAAPDLAVALVLMPLVGGASLRFLSMSNATLQLSVDPEMRARVLAMYTVAFVGTTPLGAPVVGAVGQALGARSAMAASGFAALAGGVLALRRVAFERRAGGDTVAAYVVQR